MWLWGLCHFTGLGVSFTRTVIRRRLAVDGRISDCGHKPCGSRSFGLNVQPFQDARWKSNHHWDGVGSGTCNRCVGPGVLSSSMDRCHSRVGLFSLALAPFAMWCLLVGNDPARRSLPDAHTLKLDFPAFRTKPVNISSVWVTHSQIICFGSTKCAKIVGLSRVCNTYHGSLKYYELLVLLSLVYICVIIFNWLLACKSCKVLH